MCNASVQLMNVVENEVLQRMQSRDSFTALDVSNALKVARYPVRHREVAEVVRDIYNSGAMDYYDYARQLIDVTTNSGVTTAQAYLYHHQSTQPTDYAKQNQDALPPVPSDQARDLADCVAADPLGLILRAPSGQTVSRHRARNGAVPSRTAFGRRDGALPIPRSLINRLGWTDGDALAVRAEQGKLIVESSSLPLTTSVQSPAAHSKSSSVRVWSGQRVRICKTKLKLSALTADGVTVSIDGSRLCILSCS